MIHRAHCNTNQLVKTCRAVFNQGDDFMKKITGKAKARKVFGEIHQFVTQSNKAIVT